MRAKTGRVATRVDADNALPATRPAMEALRNMATVQMRITIVGIEVVIGRAADIGFVDDSISGCCCEDEEEKRMTEEPDLIIHD
jgi:hypothetical protein